MADLDGAAPAPALYPLSYVMFACVPAADALTLGGHLPAPRGCLCDLVLDPTASHLSSLLPARIPPSRLVRL